MKAQNKMKIEFYTTDSQKHKKYREIQPYTNLNAEITASSPTVTAQ